MQSTTMKPRSSTVTTSGAVTSSGKPTSTRTVLHTLASAFPEHVLMQANQQSQQNLEDEEEQLGGVDASRKNDPILRAMEQLPMTVLEGASLGSFPLFTPLPSTLSCLVEAEGCRESAQLIRELSVLRVVLLRPSVRYSFITSYDSLMRVLAEKKAISALIDGLESAWLALRRDVATGTNGSSVNACSASSTGSNQLTTTLSTLTALVRLFTDTIILYAQHQAAHDALTAAATASLGVAQPSDEAAQSSVSEPNAACVEKIYKMAREMGAPLLPTSLRRCGALLASLAAQHVERIALSTLQEQATIRLSTSSSSSSASASYDSSFFAADLPIFAAIPVYAAMARENSSASAASGVTFLRSAVAVACCSCAYDTDIPVLFRLDDATAYRHRRRHGGDASHEVGPASLLEQVMFVTGSVMEALWETLSSQVWRFFTVEALMSAAKSMGMYAYSWVSIPASVRGLLLYASYNLNCSATTTGAVDVLLQQLGERNTCQQNEMRERDEAAWPLERGGAANLDSLLTGAVMGNSAQLKHQQQPSFFIHQSPQFSSTMSTPLFNTLEETLVATPGGLSDALRDEASSTAIATQEQTADAAGTQSLCAHVFPSKRSRMLFFMALYCHACTAFAHRCGRFEDMRTLLLWRVNPAEAQSTDRNEGSKSQSLTYEERAWPTLDAEAVQHLPLEARYTDESRTAVSMLSQCLELLAASIRTPDLLRIMQGSCHSAEYHFIEGATALLASLLLQFPHELTAVHAVAGVNILEQACFVTTALLDVAPPTAETGASQMLEGLVFTIMERFHSVFPSLSGPASRLLSRPLVESIGARCGAAEVAVSHLRLYAFLLGEDDGTDGVPAQRLLSVLCDMRPGVIGATFEGTAFYAHVLYMLSDVLDSSRCGTSSGNDTLTAGVVTLREMLGESPFPLPDLVSRICEGVWGAFQQCILNNSFFCEVPTQSVLALSLVLLGEVLHVTGQYALLPACAVPSPAFAVSLEGLHSGRVISAVHILLSVLAKPCMTYEVCYAACEVLGATLQNSDVSFFMGLRATMAKESRECLSEALHDVLRMSVGERSNVVRLVALMTLAQRDPQTLEYLTGPHSNPRNHKVSEVAELEVCQVLRDIAVDKRAACQERALALDLLRYLGAVEALSVNVVLDLLPPLKSQEGHKTAGNRKVQKNTTRKKDETGKESLQEVSGENPLETVALAAAVTAFVNAAIAAQVGKEQQQQQQPQRGAATPSMCRTPRMSSETPLSTPRLMRRTVSGNFSEATDKLVRGGTKRLEEARSLYAALYSDLYYEDRTSSGSVTTALGMAREAAGTSLSDIFSGARGTVLALPGSTLASSTARGSGVGSCFAATQHRRQHQQQGSLTRSMTMLSQRLSRALWEHTPASATTMRRSGIWTEGSVGASIYHTDALPDLPALEERDFRRPFAVVLGEHYCFYDTDDDARFNVMASLLESMGRLCAALEMTIWLTGRDAEGSGFFVSRTLALLDTTVRCTLVAKPSAPLFSRTLRVYTNRCLTLSRALAFIVEVGATAVEVEVPATLSRGLLHLVGFMQKNARDLAVVNKVLSIFRAFPGAALSSSGAWEALFAALPVALMDHATDPSDSIDVAEFITCCSAVFAQASTGASTTCCPPTTFVALFPLLVKRMVHISHDIVATAPADDLTTHYVSCIRCLGSILMNCRAAGAVVFLPRADVLAVASALGQFRFSGFYDASEQRHRPQAWHSAWVAMLDFLYTVLVTGGVSGPYSAGSTGWLAEVAAMLSASPRFLLALGGFTDVPETDRSYYAWDVAEMQRCTQLAAVLVSLGCDVALLLPRVQQCFQLVHRYRLLRQCIASSNSAEVAGSEGRAIEASLVHMVRDQLTIFLLQPSHALPTAAGAVPALAFELPSDNVSDAGLFNAPAPLGQLDGGGVYHGVGCEGAAGGGPAAAAVEKTNRVARNVSRSFDVLRRFIVQELHIIRRGGGGMGGGSGIGLGGSGFLSDTPISRETSAPRSPSFGRTMDNIDFAESVVEDNLTASELGIDVTVESRALHVDSAQLALTLLIMGAEEVVSHSASQAPGCYYTAGFQRDLRSTAEKLLHTLDGLRSQMMSMESPKLTCTVGIMRQRLKEIVTALQH